MLFDLNIMHQAKKALLPVLSFVEIFHAEVFAVSFFHFAYLDFWQHLYRICDTVSFKKS